MNCMDIIDLLLAQFSEINIEGIKAKMQIVRSGIVVLYRLPTEKSMPDRTSRVTANIVVFDRTHGPENLNP